MRTPTLLAASAIAVACFAGPAAAGGLKQGLSQGMMQLAQLSGKPQRVPCEQDPDCRQQQKQGGASGKPAKPAPEAQQQAEPAPQQEEQQAQPVPEPAPDQQQEAQPQPAPEQQQQAQPQQEQAPEQRPRERVQRNRGEEPGQDATGQNRQRDRDRQRQADEPRREEPKKAEKPRKEQRQEQQAQPRRQPDDAPLAGILRDDRPATELTDAELRQRIEVLGGALQSGRVDGRRENRVRASLDSYRGELERRITATTGRDVVNFDSRREVRRLLGDDRPASRMDEDDLRERMSLTRTVLALPGLDARSEDRLRRMLAQDREELRSRVAERERPQQRDRLGFDPGRNIGRDELRRRMHEARQERRQRLDDPSYRIVIPNRPARRHQPLPTIPLAEAYDDQIEQQLIAPPAYPVERRYTIDEYRSNPSLRTLMPGIEVDTVKFGFNEDFLREEEIIKLDRIAEIIERIVAGNPNEVFLVEGHTDLVGSAAYNEDLSWRRADAVRQALMEYYYIPRKNLEIVGYGEQFPRIPTEFEEPENRRVTIRRITPILEGRR